MTEVGPAGHKRPGSRRSELERLIDRTVLGPTHPELGTCWQFTGTTTPYGRIAKAQDSYTHRLGWKLPRGPIPEGKDSITDAACTPAGTPTISRWSPTPRIWRSGARRGRLRRGQGKRVA